MSNIAVGQTYQLINSNHDGPPMYVAVRQVFKSYGHYILFGNITMARLLVPSGVRPESPCCFPVFPHVESLKIQQLQARLNGHRLFLELNEPPYLELPDGSRHRVGSGKYMPVLNAMRKQPARTTEELIRRAEELILVWRAWERADPQIVPAWFQRVLDTETADGAGGAGSRRARLPGGVLVA